MKKQRGEGEVGVIFFILFVIFIVSLLNECHTDDLKKEIEQLKQQIKEKQ